MIYHWSITLSGETSLPWSCWNNPELLIILVGQSVMSICQQDLNKSLEPSRKGSGCIPKEWRECVVQHGMSGSVGAHRVWKWRTIWRSPVQARRRSPTISGASIRSSCRFSCSLNTQLLGSCHSHVCQQSTAPCTLQVADLYFLRAHSVFYCSILNLFSSCHKIYMCLNSFQL